MSTRDDVLQHVRNATEALAPVGITEQMRENLFVSEAVKVLLQQTYDKFTERVDEICDMVPEKYKRFASQVKDSILEASKPEDYMEAVKFQFWITIAEFIVQDDCDEATVAMLKSNIQDPAEIMEAIEILAKVGVTEQMRDELFADSGVMDLLLQMYAEINAHRADICSKVPAKHLAYAQQKATELEADFPLGDYVEEMKLNFWYVSAQYIAQVQDEEKLTEIKTLYEEPEVAIPAIMKLGGKCFDACESEFCQPLIIYMHKAANSDEEKAAVDDLANELGYTAVTAKDLMEELGFKIEEVKLPDDLDLSNGLKVSDLPLPEGVSINDVVSVIVVEVCGDSTETED